MNYSCVEKKGLTFVDKLSELDEEDNEGSIYRRGGEQKPVADKVKEEVDMNSKNVEDECISEKDRLDIKENSDEMFSKVSYETFLESIVPIGYKFECEEENNQSKNTLEAGNKTIEQLDTQKHKSHEIKIEKLSTDEIRALVSDDYLKDETLNNRVVMLNKKRKIDVKPKDDESNMLTKEKSVVEEKELEKVNKDYGIEEAKSEVNVSKADQSENNCIDIECGDKAEKVQSGELYIAWGDEVVNARRRARKLVQEFNNADPEDRQLTYNILKKLLGGVGEYIHIEPSFKCTYGKNIRVGDNFYAGYNCVILDQAKVTIGCNCIISPQVGIYTVGYPLECEMRVAGYEYAKPITIGDNVWIGGGSILNPGVTIGNNVVVAAGSVVTENIPDNVMIEGNPAHIIKYLNKVE